MNFSTLLKTGLGLVPSLTVVCLLGCDQGQDHTHSDIEDKVAQITIWTERYEIFAEHQFVVAGVPTRFITHVTDLKTLEPRSEGAIKLMMRADGVDRTLEHTEPAPDRTGIYLPELTFPEPGDWQTTIYVPTDGVDETVELPLIKVFASEHDVEHAAVPEEPDGISFLKEQQWKILSKTEPIGRKSLIERLAVPAMVIARPGSMAAVTPPIAGQLLPPQGKSIPIIGDRVEAGQTLGLILPVFSEIGVRLVESQAGLIRSKLELEQADLAYKRTQKLAQADAKSGRQLEEAEFALRIAQAKYDGALALQSTYRKASSKISKEEPEGLNNQPAIELKSPISGIIITQLGAAVGEYITAEQSVFTILDANRVFIEADIPESSTARLGEAKRASYEIPGERGRFFPIQGEGNGRLVFVGLQVDSSTRTVPLVYEVDNATSRLRIGQLVTVHVETNHAEDVLVVPDSAIVEEDGHFVVFVQVSGETFEKRELSLGVRAENWLEVVSGLSEGERVVTKGAYAIRLASVSSVIPAHGHAH